LQDECSITLCGGFVNLKEWAARNGVGYAMARRCFAEGALTVPACRVGGLVLVAGEGGPALARTTVVCASVSSAGRRRGLDRQVARVTAWATYPSEVDGDLVGDVTEILTSLCARLYGRRAAAGRAGRAVEALGQDGPA
jgi:predicted site-specific integrase-resolvase